MPLVDLPTQDDDALDNWKSIVQIGKVINTLAENLRVVVSQVRNKLTLTESSATLELILGSGGAASAPTPWQLSASPWLGVGPDPYASTRGMRYRIADGAVDDYTPTNMLTELLAFGDPTDTTRTEANAVVTFNYWQAAITETATGSGIATIAAPVIMQVQGGPTDSLRTLIGAPAIDPTTGALPAYIVGQINKCSWWGGSLHFLPGLRSYQSTGLFVSGALGGTVNRGIVYSSQDGGLTQ